MTDEEQQAWDEDGIGQPPSHDPAGSISKVLIVIAVAVILAFAIAALSACASDAVQTRTVEVKVPVAVQPIKPDQVPAVPAPLPPRPSSLSAAADVLASKWCEAVSYFLKADPLLRVSAGQQPNPLPTYPECERR
jgi:ABC-type lipoprotein release transport system permease subunit